MGIVQAISPGETGGDGLHPSNRPPSLFRSRHQIALAQFGELVYFSGNTVLGSPVLTV